MCIYISNKILCTRSICKTKYNTKLEQRGTCLIAHIVARMQLHQLLTTLQSMFGQFHNKKLVVLDSVKHTRIQFSCSMPTFNQNYWSVISSWKGKKNKDPRKRGKLETHLEQHEKAPLFGFDKSTPFARLIRSTDSSALYESEFRIFRLTLS